MPQPQHRALACLAIEIHTRHLARHRPLSRAADARIYPYRETPIRSARHARLPLRPWRLDGGGGQNVWGGGAPARPERGDVGPRGAPVAAVTPGPIGARVDKNALARGSAAYPEPVDAELGDERGQSHRRACRVPVREAAALSEVQVPRLVGVPEDLRMDRVLDEQGIQPGNGFGAIPGRRCGENLPELDLQRAHRVKVGAGDPG